MTDLIIKKVEFNGASLIGIYKEGKIYTPLRKICEFLGIDFNGQYQRIKRDETLLKGVCKIHIPSEGGLQNTLTLEISFLPLWLTGIKAQQCREEVRKNLTKFKLEAKDILADAFFGRREAFIVEEKTSLEKNVKAIQKLEKDAANILSTLKYLYAELEVTGKNNVESIDNLYLKTDGVSIFKSDINGGWSAIRSLEIKK